MNDRSGEERLDRTVRRAVDESSPPPIETVQARGRSLARRRRMLGASSIAAVAVIVVASAVVLTQGDGEPLSDIAIEPPAGLEDDDTTLDTRMRVSSDVVAPGETVELTFPEGHEETVRGVAFRLERWIEARWVHEFWLMSDRGLPDETPPLWAREGEPFGWPDIGIGGPGPDVVKIPEVAQPGRHRICTAGAIRTLCAELSIEDLEDGPDVSVQTLARGNLTFDPDGLSAPAGIIEITLAQEQFAGFHTLVFEAAFQGFELRTDGPETARIEAEPGEYVFYCRVPGHRAAGMEGVLTVTEPEPSATDDHDQAAPGPSP